MGVVTWIMKKPRLSTLVDQAGGMSARSALKAADALLEPMREEGRQRVEAAILTLELKCDAVLRSKNGVDGVYTADPRVDPTAQKLENITFQELLQRGLRVADQAAFSLCELVDRCSRLDRPVDPRGIAVHVQALRLLSAPGAIPVPARQAVLDGLQRVLDRVPA